MALRHVAATHVQRAYRNHTVRTIVAHLFAGPKSQQKQKELGGGDSGGSGAGTSGATPSAARSSSSKDDTEEDPHVGVYYLSDTFGSSWGRISAHRPDNYITKEKRSWQVRFDNGLDSFLTPERLLDLTRQHGTWRQCPRDCRKVFIRTVENPWFDRFILAVILVNCVILAMASPTLPPDSVILEIIDIADVIFSIIFFIECFLKLVAHGVQYFKSAWNLLDFVIVCESAFSLVMLLLIYFFKVDEISTGGFNPTGLRTLRVLRPLRTINHLPGLKALVTALLRSVPLLRDSLILIVFYFIVFGYAGLELWMGMFKQHCYYEATGIPVSGEDSIASSIECASSNCACGSLPGARSCPTGQVCQNTPENPNYGVTSFDNILLSFVTIFQCITLEGWAEVMYITMDVFDPLSWIYYLMLQMFGAFVLLNLLLAVVVSKFSQCQREIEMMQDESRIKSLGDASLPVLEQMGIRRRWQRAGDDDGGAAGEGAATHGTRQRRKAAGRHDIVYASQIAQRQLANSIESMKKIKNGADARDGGAGGAPADNSGGGDGGGAAGTLRIASLHPAALLKRGDVDDDRDLVYLSRIANYLEAEYLPPNPHEAPAPVEKNDDDDGEPQPIDMARERMARNIIEWVCFLIVSAKMFDIVIYMCICGNTVALALEFHGSPVLMDVILAWSNMIFTYIFTLEMLLKLAAYGLGAYMADRMNILDAGVTVLGLVEMLFTSSSALVAFRAVRFFRLFRLMRYMKSLQKIVQVIASSFMSILYATLLLSLFSFIFTIFGMQFFGGKFIFPGDTEIPRNNFDNVHHSFITVFQILAGENWPAVMYDGVRATGWFGVIYFLLWVVLGQFILLNLFLAVLMDNFDKIGKDADGAKAKEEARAQAILEKKQLAREQRRLRRFKKKSKRIANALAKRVQKSQQRISRLERRVHDLRVLMRTHRAHQDQIDAVLHDMRDEIANLNIIKATTIGTPAAMMLADDAKTRNDKICCCCTETTGIVVCSRKIIGNPWFDRFILCLITISSLLMAVDGPETAANEQLTLGLLIVDVAFTTLFTLEVIIKMQALGVICHHTAYLRDSWNILDFIVVGASLGNLTLEFVTRTNLLQSDSDLSFVKILRLLRILRPLRMINRNPNMKLVVNALLLSVKPLINVAVVLMLIWFMFALVGVQFFAGKLYACNDPDFPPGGPRNGGWFEDENISPCDSSVYYNNTYGELTPREWINSPSNFDNIVSAMVTLYVMATGEGWPGIMFKTADITEVDHHPKRDNQMWNTYYFVLFISITVFFFLELVIGAIFQNFIELKRKTEMGLLTDDQRRWVDQQKKLRKEKPSKEHFPDSLLLCQGYIVRQDTEREGQNFRPCPYHCFACLNTSRKLLYGLVHHAAFDIFIAGCIAVNMMVMCSAYQGMSPVYEAVLDWLNFAFVIIFTLELVFKLIAMGFVRFFGLQIRCGVEKVVAANAFDNDDDDSEDDENETNSEGGANEEKTGEGSGGGAATKSGGAAGDKDDASTEEEKAAAAEKKSKASKAPSRRCKCVCQFDRWNFFDAVIVVISWINWAVEFYKISFLRALRLGKVMRITKLLRGARAVRIIKFFKGLRGIMTTLVISLPSLMNVGSLLFLLFFIFAVLGIALFGETEYGDHYNRHANFRNFGMSLLTLFRCSTGEDWQDIMYDIIAKRPDGAVSLIWSLQAHIYFVVFEFFSSFIVLNLFVMIITENFDYSNAESRSLMSEIELYKFRELWQKFDPIGTKYIPVDRLKTFLEALGPPLGLCKQSTFQQYFQLALELELHNFSGGISFTELLCKCHRNAFTKHFESDIMDRIDNNDRRVEEEVLEDTLNRARRVTGAKAEILQRISTDTVMQGTQAAREKLRKQMEGGADSSFARSAQKGNPLKHLNDDAQAAMDRMEEINVRRVWLRLRLQSRATTAQVCTSCHDSVNAPYPSPRARSPSPSLSLSLSPLFSYL